MSTVTVTETVPVTVEETIPPTVTEAVPVTVKDDIPSGVDVNTVKLDTTVNEDVTVDVSPTVQVSVKDDSPVAEVKEGGISAKKTVDKGIRGNEQTPFTSAISEYRPIANVGDTHDTPGAMASIDEEKLAAPRRSDGPEASAGGGRGGGGIKEGINCFGVKSYLHHFYDAKEADVAPGIYEDFQVDPDDFEYLVEPGKRRARWCQWFRWSIWLGANLLLVGLVTLLVGHLTSERRVVVDVSDNIEVLDRWAISFNQRLEFCRLAGLVIFFAGGMVIFAAMLASTCVGENNHSDVCCCFGKTPFYATGTTPLLEPYRAEPDAMGRIPITEEIKPVQPAVEKMAGLAGVGMQVPYY